MGMTPVTRQNCESAVAFRKNIMNGSEARAVVKKINLLLLVHYVRDGPLSRPVSPQPALLHVPNEKL